MASKESTFGARVYYYDDGVILIKQTVKSPSSGRYVIDAGDAGSHKERHIDPGDDAALCDAIRLAGQGKL